MACDKMEGLYGAVWRLLLLQIDQTYPVFRDPHISDDHALLASAVQQQVIHYRRLEHIHTRLTD